MPMYSQSSLSRLAECAQPLRELFAEVIKYYDHDIRCGYRGEEAQNLAYKIKASKTPWPESMHNKKPSRAVDAYPWVNGKPSDDPRVCREFAGFVLGIAAKMGIKIRWGGDWDSDHDPTDQSFNDLVHFEMTEAV